MKKYIATQYEGLSLTFAKGDTIEGAYQAWLDLYKDEAIVLEKREVGIQAGDLLTVNVVEWREPTEEEKQSWEEEHPKDTEISWACKRLAKTFQYKVTKSDTGEEVPEIYGTPISISPLLC
jgi:hypothetical protein